MKMHSSDGQSVVSGWPARRDRTTGLINKMLRQVTTWQDKGRQNRNMSRLAASLAQLDDRLLRDIGLSRHEIKEFTKQIYAATASDLPGIGGAQ